VALKPPDCTRGIRHGFPRLVRSLHLQATVLPERTGAYANAVQTGGKESACERAVGGGGFATAARHGRSVVVAAATNQAAERARARTRNLDPQTGHLQRVQKG